jgi:hypothetical protein
MNGMDNLWKAGNLCWRLPGSQKPLLPQQNLGRISVFERVKRGPIS